MFTIFKAPVHKRKWFELFSFKDNKVSQAMYQQNTITEIVTVPNCSKSQSIVLGTDCITTYALRYLSDQQLLEDTQSPFMP